MRMFEYGKQLASQDLQSCNPADQASDSWLTVVGHIPSPHPQCRIIYAFPWSTYVVCMKGRHCCSV